MVVTKKWENRINANSKIWVENSRRSGLRPSDHQRDAFAVPVAQQLHEPVSKPVDLDARIAETGQLESHLRTNLQGGDVLAELAGTDIVILLRNSPEQFFMDHVNLAEVRLQFTATTDCDIFTTIPL